jgi:hypothetical protein
MGVRSRSTAGGAQFGLAVAGTVVTLTVPDAAMAAELYVRTAPLVFTRDGTDPTSTKGIQANVGDLIVLNSRDECDKWKGIEQTSTDSSMDVEYWTDISG